MAFLAPIIASGAGKMLPTLIGAAVIAVASGAAVEVYEHRAPWGLAHQRDAAHDLALTNAINWRSMRADRDAWTKADKACEAKRVDENQQTTALIDFASLERDKNSSEAFDNGYAAGKVSGRKSCGAINATSPSSPGLVPQPGGMRDGSGQDLSDLFHHRPDSAGGSVPPHD